MNKINTYIKKHFILLTILLLTFATLISFLFLYIIPDALANISLVYVLALVMIARYTDGYRYGVIASIFSVICVNYFFTYPHFKLNFTISGYPITFIVMMGITLSTCTITSHMKHQAELLTRHEKQLMEADKEKMRANLLRAVSHDLRTPLTSIIGSISSLKENDASLTHEEKSKIEDHIYDDANWLLNMVENLLSITRIQNDTTKVKKSMEVVEEVISEAITRLKKRIPDVNVIVSAPDELLMIPMDAILIEQVIINLVENATVHSQSKKPIRLTITTTNENVSFHVIDYGIGIEKSRIDKLFDGLSYKNTNSSDSHKGMGIGLSICKTIILAHDGSIGVTPHSEGTEFTFTLPKEREE